MGGGVAAESGDAGHPGGGHGAGGHAEEGRGGPSRLGRRHGVAEGRLVLVVRVLVVDSVGARPSLPSHQQSHQHYQNYTHTHT